MAHKTYATPKVVANEDACTFQTPVMTPIPKETLLLYEVRRPNIDLSQNITTL
jgi:hypothetical protein